MDIPLQIPIYYLSLFFFNICGFQADSQIQWQPYTNLHYTISCYFCHCRSQIWRPCTYLLYWKISCNCCDLVWTCDFWTCQWHHGHIHYQRHLGNGLQNLRCKGKKMHPNDGVALFAGHWILFYLRIVKN